MGNSCTRGRSARVPRELRKVWADKEGMIVSQDGACIDFHGGGKDLCEPNYFTLNELERVTDAFVVSLLDDEVTSINVAQCKGLTDESIKTTARKCPKLKEVNVSSITNLTDESIKAIATRCRELEKLTVSYLINLTDESILQIATACPKLKVLTVSCFRSNFTDKSIMQISDCCPELRELDVSDITKLTDKSIKAIAKDCPELKELNVSYITNLTDETIKAIATGCRELKELNVSYITNLTDESIQAIATACLELMKINVETCSSITDDSIQAIAKHCLELEAINVGSCSNLTDEAIKAIAKGCPELKEINVESCFSLTDESITAIAERCSKLQELNVSYVHDLTDESIKAIAEGCPKLKKLNVSYIYNLTDESIKAIARRCPELKELKADYSKNLTDESIKAIAEGCPGLKELNVYGTHLTDESIMALAIGRPELKDRNVYGTEHMEESIAKGGSVLRKVNVEFCNNLTNKSIKAIAEECPELEELNVSQCDKLTDESIEAIATGCPKLKQLDVRSLNLTDAAIKAIATRCHRLKKLNVSQCDQVTHESIKAIARGCPRLRELEAKRCELRSLPNDIGDRLPQLQLLDISYNNVRKLPRSIVKLKNLRELGVSRNPLQSPPLEIAKHGLGAIERYFEELKNDRIVSKLLKVVLVGDGEAGKTTLRNALAGHPNPRHKDRTIYVDIEKITLADNLDINVYDCGGQEEYLATQLPFLKGLALYIIVVDAQYASEEHKDKLEAKLHRFLLILQNRVPGAVVMPIVTKVDNFKDADKRCDWLDSKIKEWRQDTHKAVFGDLPEASADRPRPQPASVADANDMRNAGNFYEQDFIPIDVPLRPLPVSVPDTDDKQAVCNSVDAVRKHIIDLIEKSPQLSRGIGQQIPATYMQVLKLFGAIAEYGDNDLALGALRNGGARALGETSQLSQHGTYRPKEELKKVWNTYRNDPLVRVNSTVFEDATQLWEAQGLVFVDAGLVVLQPEFIKTIVEPLVDHRHNDEMEYKNFENVVPQFLTSSLQNEEKECTHCNKDVAQNSTLSRDEKNNNFHYNQLKEALRNFRDYGEVEIENSHESLFLSFLWRKTRLDKSHYDQVLQMLATCGVILKVNRDAGRRGTFVVVPFRLPQHPNKTELELKWPKSLSSEERELEVRFEPRLGFPTGLVERFVTDVHRLGTSLYSWRCGVVMDCAGYRALAERRENALHFTVRFESDSSKTADTAQKAANAAWKALCDAQQMLGAQRESRFPGLFYDERLVCEECSRKRHGPVSTQLFDAKNIKSTFRRCGHHFELDWKGKCDASTAIYNFNDGVSHSNFIANADTVNTVHESRNVS